MHNRNTINRRSFLKMGALAAGFSAVKPASILASPASGSFHDSRIKLSLAAYSFRDQFKAGELTMEAFIDYCDKLKLDGTELTSYFFDAETDAYLLNLRSKCFHLGLPISGTAIGNNFVTPDKNERRKEIEDVKGWIDKAVVLGAPSIRIFGGGGIPDGHTEKDAYDWVLPALHECVEYAGKHGIVLAIENHGGFPTTSEQLIKLVHEMDSPWCGANLDTGNFTEDWYRQIDEVAPYAVVVQLKPHVRPGWKSPVEGGKPVPADIAGIVRTLKNVGYRRYLVLEYEAEDPYENIPKWIDRLNDLIG